MPRNLQWLPIASKTKTKALTLAFTALHTQSSASLTGPQAKPPLPTGTHPTCGRCCLIRCCILLLEHIPPSSLSFTSCSKRSLHLTSLSLCSLIRQVDVHRAHFGGVSMTTECSKSTVRTLKIVTMGHLLVIPPPPLLPIPRYPAGRAKA